MGETFVPSISAIIDGKKYDSDNATLIASDRYFDGSNWERRGRNTFLMKTGKGAFFIIRYTQWQGERTHIEVVSKEYAMELYEQLPEQEVSYFDAFGVEPAEA
ncbi:MAG: hypothetical protein PHI12_13105 [Dehalococcoidales bacterium]|nr:hypothetical protein [Dehalococcoidales bacterium]